MQCKTIGNEQRKNGKKYLVHFSKIEITKQIYENFEKVSNFKVEKKRFVYDTTKKTIGLSGLIMKITRQSISKVFIISVHFLDMTFIIQSAIQRFFV